MHLTERQWKNIARDLQSQRCVLFLGGRLVSDATGAPLSVALANHLARILDQEGVSYEKSAEGRLHYIAQRFMTIPKIRRTDLEDEVDEFYRKNAQTIPDIYRRIAQLPLSLIVNTTPDTLMLRALHAAGKTGARSVHYNFRRERNLDTSAIKPDTPLVYNLWGALHDPESLVLSQEDRVEFIKNVVRGNPSIPNEVMGCFDERKTYIFLGFNFENWDARLLMDSFKLSRENTSISPQTGAYALRPETQSFFEDRYRFVFVAQQTDNFIEQWETSFSALNADNAPTPRTERRRQICLLHAANDTDAQCCRQLLKHLQTWAEEAQTDIWRPDLILEGNIAEQTLQAIEKADLIVPILSADFLNEAAADIRALVNAHHTRGALVAPALFRACPWDETPLAAFHPLPGRNQNLQSHPDPDEAYTLIAKRIKSMLIHDGG